MNFRNARYIFIPNSVKIKNNGANFAYQLLEINKYPYPKTHQITMPASATNLSHCFSGVPSLNSDSWIVYQEDGISTVMNRPVPGCTSNFANAIDMSSAFAGIKMRGTLKYGENTTNISHMCEYTTNGRYAFFITYCGNNVIDISYAFRNCTGIPT